MPNEFLSPEGDLENYFITESWLIDQWINDDLFLWGSDNGAGALGNNVSFSDISTPITTFAGGSNWKQLSCAYDHAAAIKMDGTLWVWGSGQLGQLGLNYVPGAVMFNRSTPVTTFAGGNTWKQVSTTDRRTAAIKNDGTLWIWGYNFNGEMGVNDGNSRTTPVTTFAGGNDWKQVSLGASGNCHVAAIKTDGTLWVWGNNTYGQLGTNDSISKSTPVTTFAGGNNWKQVSCGGNSSLIAIKTDGTLWACGSNAGTNDSVARSTPVTTFAGGNNWKQVSCGGGANNSAIKTDGTLWVWGSGVYGRLGTNDSGTKLTPVTTFAGGNDWKQVSSAYAHTAAIKTDGTLWLWGTNSFFGASKGRLGTNDAIDRSTPVTTFAGGNTWKQVSAGTLFTGALSSEGGSSDYVQPPAPLDWEMLLVAGGGGTLATIFPSAIDDSLGATFSASGGGGGGGLRTTNGTTISGSSLYLTVGAGGAASDTSTSIGSSTYYSLTPGGAAVISASGGGNGSNLAPRDGGSGGGGCGQDWKFNGTARGNGTPGQGNNGGAGRNDVSFSSGSAASGGGGGGWGSPGADGAANAGGNGGSGYNLVGFAGGTPVYLGWGGGGGGATRGLNGDQQNNPTIDNAPANSGGGGRGRSTTGGSTGGSGQIVIRYIGNSARAVGGTITYQTVGGVNYVIHTFTGSNTFTVA